VAWIFELGGGFLGNDWGVPLSSSSTTTQVLAAYADNANYEENDSLAEAKAFVSACRQLLSPKHLVSRSASGGRAGTEVEYDPGVIEREKDRAQRWIEQKLGESGNVVHADFTGFRD
jgi:hypothetical protein